MRADTDERRFLAMYMETPFGCQIRTNAGELRGPESRAEAFRTPGCHVKSRELAGNRWPLYFGKLTSYSEKVDHVIVISKGPTHGIDGKPTVWSGTIAEYQRMWECD